MGTKPQDTATAIAIEQSFQSPNVADSNLEVANVVDVISHLAQSAYRISTAISAAAVAGEDATGGKVDSLTEAVMGVTAGLVRIADAIGDLAEAVRENKSE